LKPALIAFHLFMVIFYFGVGGILVFSPFFPSVSGSARNILGYLLMAFAVYRCFHIYNNFIRKKDGRQ